MNVRKKMFNRFIAGCMALFVAITAFPVNSYAKEPTLETPYQTLTVGSNQMKISDYNRKEDILFGCFVVPETGKYSITIANNGEVNAEYYLLDENLSRIASSINFLNHTVEPLHNYEFDKMSVKTLKKNEKIYVYVNGLKDGLLAAKVTIKQTDVKPTTKKPQLNKQAVSLARNRKVTLKLKNNKKKVIWVSSNKRIATVTSKGVVKAKKKGTAYIYAIANHKLYKCKISVYR